MATSAPDEVDVVIVGSGAAGSLYAAVLAESGKSVLILESGQDHKLSDLYSSQIWSRRLKWSSPTVEESGPDNLGFMFNAGQGVGGAALHHYAVWPRFHEEDFRVRSLYGRSLDWPFEYRELRPYYDEVQEFVGISGDAAQEIWRPPGDPYPLPPIPLTQQGQTIARGFAALDMHTAPLPMAVLTRPYNGRAACVWDGWCDAGCPIGALANPLVTYLPRAQNAGARVLAQSHATRVVADKTGRKAIGVEYRSPTGELIFQGARLVVLCAYNIENVRILLNSRTTGQPNGLANSSGLVGRYLMSHPGMMVRGLFDMDMQNHLGTPGGQLICQDRFGKRDGPAFGSRQWLIALATKPNDLTGVAMTRADLFGEALHRFVRDASRSLGSMASVGEDEPSEENRVELSSNTDSHGLPLARVIYRRSDNSKRLALTAAAEGMEIFKAAGARETWHGPPVGHHILGGTIMGLDPARSVLNAAAQSHDVDNLFVGGSGIFPTSSAVNPTFTLSALALKSAKFIVSNWSGITA